MFTKNIWRRRKSLMKSKVLSGLLLTIALTLLWVFAPEPVHQVIEHPKNLVIKEVKASGVEKRENIRISKRYAYILYKWGKGEQACLVSLWTSESRFDNHARPRDGKGRILSSAYGIAQLLGERSNDPREQILKGLIYISHRYDTPCRAKSFHDGHNYY
jgi:hypothetical protein